MLLYTVVASDLLRSSTAINIRSIVPEYASTLVPGTHVVFVQRIIDNKHITQ